MKSVMPLPRVFTGKKSYLNEGSLNSLTSRSQSSADIITPWRLGNNYHMTFVNQLKVWQDIVWLKLIFIFYYYSFVSTSRWFLTGVWPTSSFLKSPGPFSVFWPKFGWSPYFQVLHFLHHSFHDSTKSTDYNWYNRHVHVPQLLFLSILIQGRLYVLRFFFSFTQWSTGSFLLLLLLVVVVVVVLVFVCYASLGISHFYDRLTSPLEYFHKTYTLLTQYILIKFCQVVQLIVPQSAISNSLFYFDFWNHQIQS